MRFASLDKATSARRVEVRLAARRVGPALAVRGTGGNFDALKNSGGVFMKSFLFGFGMGIGLGVLFAPMSGEQTRQNLADRATDLADTARETSDQIRDRVRSGMSAIRGGAEQRPTGTEGNV